MSHFLRAKGAQIDPLVGVTCPPWSRDEQNLWLRFSGAGQDLVISLDGDLAPVTHEFPPAEQQARRNAVLAGDYETFILSCKLLDQLQLLNHVPPSTLDRGQPLHHCFPVRTRSGHRARPISYAWRDARPKWGHFTGYYGVLRLLIPFTMSPFFSGLPDRFALRTRRVGAGCVPRYQIGYQDSYENLNSSLNSHPCQQKILLKSTIYLVIAIGIDCRYFFTMRTLFQTCQAREQQCRRFIC